jgi:tRNA (cytidine/uridine-2'-O-)-methyltransferase
VTRHRSWPAFLEWRKPGSRLILLTTGAPLLYHRCLFQEEDILIVGRESAGVPEMVHQAADLRVKVPMRPGMRSLNVALAAAIVLSEALRQAGRLPAEAPP